jgi:hypothetical protein
MMMYDDVARNTNPQAHCLASRRTPLSILVAGFGLLCPIPQKERVNKPSGSELVLTYIVFLNKLMLWLKWSILLFKARLLYYLLQVA